MSNLQLNTTNGSVTLVPEDGAGNVNVTIPRHGFGGMVQMVVGNDVETANTTYNATWQEVSTSLRTSITLKTDNPIIQILWIANPETDASTEDREFCKFMMDNNGGGYNNVGNSHYLSLGVSVPQEGNSNIIDVFVVTANAGDVLTFSPYVRTESGNSTPLQFGQNFVTDPGIGCKMVISEIAN